MIEMILLGDREAIMATPLDFVEKDACQDGHAVADALRIV